MARTSWKTREASLERARRQIHGGDHAGALRTLLTLWRAAPGLPDACLGDAIGRLGDDLGASAEPIHGNAAERQRAWLKRGTKRRGHEAEVDLLLTDLGQVSLAAAMARLEAIAAWPSDPRVDRAVVRLLSETPYPTVAARSFWREVFARAAKLRDPRALADLDEALEALQRNIALELKTFAREQGQQLDGALAATRRRKESALSAEQRQQLDGLGKRAASREALQAQADELLATIQADPDDDGARRVYADVLNELGDPRGAFIELSFRQREGELTRDQQRKLNKLLKVHGRDWLGPLDRVITRWKLAFERGFLAGCRLRKMGAEAAEKLAGDPLWSTVERFEGPAPIYLHPGMRALREVVADADGAEALLAGATARPRIETLVYVGPRTPNTRALRGLRATDWPEVELDAREIALLRECRGLPGLRHLHLRNADLQPWVPGSGLRPESWRWIFDAPVLSRLERLTLPSYYGYFGAWLETLAPLELPSELCFALDMGMLDRCEITRAAPSAGARARVELAIEVGSGQEGFATQTVCGAFASVPPEGATYGELLVRWSGLPPNARQTENLCAAIERLGSRATIELPGESP
jgi:uncharacterized protein (TIGR02996 family)